MEEAITMIEANDNIPYFGGCPHCLHSDGFLNVGREHWCVCHGHKMKWCVGENLWTVLETEDELRTNAYRLANYMECEPVMPAQREAEWTPPAGHGVHEGG
jgi:hypothetical protein